MTIAELHGKISHTGTNLHERLEDLLTADVFGPIRYLANGLAAVELLKGARGPLTSSAPAHSRTLVEHPAVATLLAGGPDQRPRVKFWPRLTRSEPDVLLDWSLPNGSHLLVMIEVKLHHGKSGEGAIEEAGEVVVADQLCREYQDLVDRLGVNDHGILIYLTADAGPPRKGLADSLELIHPDARVGIYWLNWIGIYRAIRASRSARALPTWEDTLWLDMQLLLERKGLTGLRPWDEVLPAGWPDPEPWRYVRRTRQQQYRWPITPKVPLRRWYSSEPPTGYRWAAKPPGVNAVMFYHSKGRG